MTPSNSAFHLPARLAAKGEPTLIADDERRFAEIAESLGRSIADLSARLEATLRDPGGPGQAAMDRDMEVHRLTARLRTLRRFGLDLCLGRTVAASDGVATYIGRLGLADAGGRRLLVDWRTPAAEPYFAATPATPMGVISRRRYRWTGGRVSDYWDEVFDTGVLEGAALESRAALDDESAFIASLGASRSSRMRDVLSTIQSDQDAIIRAPSRGALVVDGGPGTGKTVVALHRAAYLLYADPRFGSAKAGPSATGPRHGGLLFVGPHEPYLAYVADILPGLGEDGVQTCTLRDLVPAGASAATEPDPDVARLKSSARMVDAVEPAITLYEDPPERGMAVETPWSEVWLSAEDWAEAFDAAEAGVPHNEARDDVLEALLEIIADKHDEDVPRAPLRRQLLQNEPLMRAFAKSWPILEAEYVVATLWSVPAYLRRCAPWLEPAEVRRLQRPDTAAWTASDLPLLDAARRRLGDPRASVARRRREAQLAAEREERARVIDHLIDADDSEMSVMSMLRGEDFQNALDDETGLPRTDPDALAGPFAHIVVDEAQELTDAEWQMLVARCPSRSFTIVGDRAQARHGFTESWRERLERVGLSRVEVASLTVNYRTPQEVMAVAEPVIRAALPDANVPTSVRSSGSPVVHGGIADLGLTLQDWLTAHDEGVACVISVRGAGVVVPQSTRVRVLTPETAKGLEFDLVVVIDPAGFGTGIEAAVDRYVSMTRATQQLVLLTPD